MKKTKLFELVTGTEMKPRLSRNMLPIINTCKNGWSNFSGNRRVVSLKLLELTQFAWPNQSIYFNFWCAVPRGDVIESTRFLMRPPVIILPCYKALTTSTNIQNAFNFSSCIHKKPLIPLILVKWVQITNIIAFNSHN